MSSPPCPASIGRRLLSGRTGVARLARGLWYAALCVCVGGCANADGAPGGGGAGAAQSTGTGASGPTAPAPAADPVLRRGDRGQAAQDLQTLLNGWRQREGVTLLVPDGIFGSRTEKAVTRFQADHALPATGVADQATWTALRVSKQTDRLGTLDPQAGPTASDRYRSSGHQTPNVEIHLLPSMEVRPGVFERPLLYQSSMAIDADGAGNAWRSDPWGQPTTSLTHPGGASLNPTITPYFVLPIGFDTAHPAVNLGDLAAIVYRNRVTYAIFGDRGPRTKIGEASIKTAQLLGINADPVRGGAGEGVTTIVFPGSAGRPPLSPAEIETRGRALLRAAGGNP